MFGGGYPRAPHPCHTYPHMETCPLTHIQSHTYTSLCTSMHISICKLFTQIPTPAHPHMYILVSRDVSSHTCSVDTVCICIYIPPCISIHRDMLNSMYPNLHTPSILPHVNTDIHTYPHTIHTPTYKHRHTYIPTHHPYSHM